MKPKGFLATLLYSLFVHTVWLQRRRLTSRLWFKLWNKSSALFSTSVTTRIHGRRVRVNYGFPYPIIVRQFPLFNNPLIELVFQKYLQKQSTVNIIDIGASVGDTVLLLSANCVGMVGDVFCVEGDAEFCSYLHHNLKFYHNKTIVNVLLSSEDASMPSLVRTHSGTASSLGTTAAPSTSLDTLLLQERRSWDIIKIDVDGFDGKVLEGARNTLARSKPEIIFEWHPLLCERTQNNWHSHFDTLFSCGYTRFIFFTKFGDFSHFMIGRDSASIEALAKFSMQSKSYEDWHYDVIALHQSSTVDQNILSDCAFARSKQSRF
jgi:FkbM family methyltransferase